jgi:hypothetical protein
MFMVEILVVSVMAVMSNVCSGDECGGVCG